MFLLNRGLRKGLCRRSSVSYDDWKKRYPLYFRMLFMKIRKGISVVPSFKTTSLAYDEGLIEPG